MLLEGISPEEDEAMLLDDEAPASAVGAPACGRIRTPHGIDDRPLRERHECRHDEQAEHQAEKAPQRSATRALYQFMKSEIDRLIVR